MAVAQRILVECADASDVYDGNGEKWEFAGEGRGIAVLSFWMRSAYPAA